MMNFHKDYKNSLNSDYLNTGYYLPSSKIAATTSIQASNQIAELSQRLNLGTKNVEISGPLQPRTFQQIPAQHFEELKRAAKLTDASLSLHAPLIDIIGFSEQGNWSEYQRKRAEEYLKDVLSKAQKMDVKGNIPVTVHTNAGIPAYAWEKGLEEKKGEEAKAYPKPPAAKTLFAIDQESGRVLPVEYEKKEYLGGTKIWYPEERLELHNENAWDEDKLRIFSLRKDSEEITDRKFRAEQKANELEYFHRQGVATPEQVNMLNELNKQITVWDNHIHENQRRIDSTLGEMHHKFASYPDRENEEVYRAAQKKLEEYKEQYKAQEQLKLRILEEGRQKLQATASPDEKNRVALEYQEKIMEINKANTENTLAVFSGLPHPEVLIPVDDFAKQKASDTVANAAFYAYNNLGGEKAPTLAVENWHPETALSRGENFREFLDVSKDKFAKKLIKEKNLSDEAARMAADKLIGATWDVSHINMLKRFGYKDEEIAQEIKHIAKPGLVKKIHLADNFGFEDTHLVPGMGNAPIGRQLEILEKYGALKDAQQVLEAGTFDVEFKESSFPYALEAFNSPLYTYSMEPSWRNIREVYGQYNYGFGDILPDLHFRTHYGGGFSNLPKELGGQIAQDRSRFTGDQFE